MLDLPRLMGKIRYFSWFQEAAGRSHSAYNFPF